MSGIRIRCVTSEDISVISQIENSSFSDPWSENSFREALENPLMHFRCAENEAGEICGYSLMMVFDEDGEIMSIASSPDHRREGIGKLLLSRMISEAAECGAKNIYLEVRFSNNPAITLYVSNEFKKIGIRKNYYRLPREDALVMRRCLSDDT